MKTNLLKLKRAYLKWKFEEIEGAKRPATLEMKQAYDRVVGVASFRQYNSLREWVKSLGHAMIAWD